MDTKKCTKCGSEKTLTEYYKDKRKAQGLYAACKTCHLKSADSWRINNKPAKNKLQRDWKKFNPIKVKELKKKHETKFPERLANQRRKRIGRQIDNLTDWYVGKVLKETNKLVTPETIELKRNIIAIKRFKKAINGKSTKTIANE